MENGDAWRMSEVELAPEEEIRVRREIKAKISYLNKLCQKSKRGKCIENAELSKRCKLY